LKARAGLLQADAQGEEPVDAFERHATAFAAADRVCRGRNEAGRIRLSVNATFAAAAESAPGLAIRSSHACLNGPSCHVAGLLTTAILPRQGNVADSVLDEAPVVVLAFGSAQCGAQVCRGLPRPDRLPAGRNLTTAASALAWKFNILAHA